MALPPISDGTSRQDTRGISCPEGISLLEMMLVVMLILIIANPSVDGLPTDPFTGSNQSWQEVMEDKPLSPSQTSLGIVDVHSGSNDLAFDGTPYSTW